MTISPAVVARTNGESPLDGETTEVVIGFGGGVIVTPACPNFVVSAWAVAVTVAVTFTEVIGAVYKPEDEMVPALAAQLTAVFALPVTVAVNCCVLPDAMVADDGETETLTWGGGGAVVLELPPPPPHPVVVRQRMAWRAKAIETTEVFFMRDCSPSTCVLCRSPAGFVAREIAFLAAADKSASPFFGSKNL